MSTIVKELLSTIYSGESPYSTASISGVDHGYPHTNIQADLCQELFRHIAPTYIVECGSMLGGSVKVMANALASLSMDTNIICIDPFCGDVNMWAWEKGLSERNEWRFLRLENGLPTIYKRFLSNMIFEGLADRVLPLVCSTCVGTKLLKRLHDEQRISSLPNIIYLDSAHEPEETYVELKACWIMLPPCGVLFGDDWGWDSVRNDVIRFASDFASEIDSNGLQIDLPGVAIYGGNIIIYRGQWVLYKTKNDPE